MNQICGGRADMTSRGIIFVRRKVSVHTLPATAKIFVAQPGLVPLHLSQHRPAFDFSVATTAMKCQLEKSHVVIT
jgi:hypothetical protein